MPVPTVLRRGTPREALWCRVTRCRSIRDARSMCRTTGSEEPTRARCSALLRGGQCTPRAASRWQPAGGGRAVRRHRSAARTRWCRGRARRFEWSKDGREGSVSSRGDLREVSGKECCFVFVVEGRGCAGCYEVFESVRHGPFVVDRHDRHRIKSFCRRGIADLVHRSLGEDEDIALPQRVVCSSLVASASPDSTMKISTESGWELSGCAPPGSQTSKNTLVGDPSLGPASGMSLTASVGEMRRAVKSSMFFTVGASAR